MIAIRHLDFWYRRKEELIAGLTLDLHPGHIYGLMGKNGVGKTTLLKILSGLSFPKAGEVRLDQWDPAKRDPRFLEELLFLQEELWFPPVVAEGLVRLYAPFYPRFDRQQFMAGLEKLEVDNISRLGKLSYGQRKKVMIAFALACNTRFLFLDEPTNGLDIPSKAAFRSLLASAFADDRIIILSTHQVRDLQSLIDHVLILSGRTMLVNEPLETIASRLVFHESPVLPEHSGMIYSWRKELGYSFILPNSGEEPGSVDLETLFNASLEVPGLFTGKWQQQRVTQ